MLHEDDLRKALKTVMFLILAVTAAGCYSLRTASLSSIPQKRNVIMLHADDSLWAVSNYTVSDGILTGLIYQDSLKITKLKVTHLYVAPATAVKIDGTRLSVPAGNIAKTDYWVVDLWLTLGGVAAIAIVAFTFLPSLFY
jgi:hypothetical protein